MLLSYQLHCGFCSPIASPRPKQRAERAEVRIWEFLMGNSILIETEQVMQALGNTLN